MNKLNFGKIIKQMERVKRDLPIKIANETKNYFLSSWSKQGWDGEMWRPPLRKSKKGGSSRNNSATLVQSGRLRRDVANSLKQANFDKIIFRVQSPYAQIHNEGLMGKAFGKYPFKMPKRQFIGQTRELTNKQMGIIKKEAGSIWNA